jgi:hypothetical protein
MYIPKALIRRSTEMEAAAGINHHYGDDANSEPGAHTDWSLISFGQLKSLQSLPSSSNGWK